MASAENHGVQVASAPTPTRVSGLNQQFVIHEHNGPSDGVHSVVRLLDACGGDQKLFEAAVAASTTISESSAKIWDDRSEREHAQAKGILALILEALPTVVGEFERAREKAGKRREKSEAKADAKTGTIRVEKKSWDGLLAEVNQLREDLRDAVAIARDLGGDPADPEVVIEQLKAHVEVLAAECSSEYERGLSDGQDASNAEGDRLTAMVEQLKAKMAEADERLMSERELRAELLNTRESLQEGAKKTAPASKGKKKRSTVSKGKSTETSIEA